jgi:hypothetical protein
MILPDVDVVIYAFRSDVAQLDRDYARFPELRRQTPAA